jgi:hypothetical protein
VSLERSIAFTLKNSGLPVPSKILPWDWDKECQFMSSQSDIYNKPCKYGNYNSGKSILLIGDSHAASISRAIISLGDSNELNTFVFTFAACGFVLSSKEFNPLLSYPSLTPDCIRHNQSILNFIQKSKPTVVVYANRSSSSGVSPNNFASRTQYRELIAKNLKVLMQEDIDIIQIGSVPELLSTKVVLQQILGTRSQFSKIPFEDNSFWESNRVTDYYLNTLDIFCSEKVCSNNSPDGWLFQDANHLSEIGANRLVPKLDSLIKLILDKES